MSCINSPKVEILHTEIPFTIEPCCDDRTSNALFASNGALYSSEAEDEQEPVFVSDYLIQGVDTPL